MVVNEAAAAVLLRYDVDAAELFQLTTRLGQIFRTLLQAYIDADMAEFGASLAQRNEAFWVNRLLLQRMQTEEETQKARPCQAGQAKGR